MFDLNTPQTRFFAMPQKFRAFVAGYGCVSPDTRIWTEHGLMRICDISRPIRVLSWSEKDQQLQLSLSGGAFPKGKASLIRVATSRGEFESTAHHQIFSSGRKYSPAGDLVAGSSLLATSLDLRLTTEELARKSSPSSDPHSSQINADLMGRYADEARRYGQRLLSGEDGARWCVQQPAGAHKSFPCFGSLAFAHVGGPGAHSSTHIRHDLSGDQIDMSRSVPQMLSHACGAAGRASASALAHIFAFRQVFQQFAQTFSPHRKARKPAPVCHSTCNSPEQVSEVEVLRVMVGESSVYYDMQVLDTNNYVDEFGHIHHNSGKTWVGGAAQCGGFHTHPRINQGYFAPTYSHIRDIFFPTIEEVAANWGLRVETRESNKEVHFYEGRQYLGTTICRSMDDPGNIVGFKIGRALVDELDVLKREHARTAWRKIIARMRYKDAPNQVDVTTTPEGFRFTYERFVSSLRESPELRGQYGMVQASTLENRKNLPEDYIPSLMQDYPEALRGAYIRGEFVNLTHGSVYPSFNRVMNATKARVESGEHLHIGMDFNVGKMAAVVHVIRDGKPLALAERCKILDTPAMVQRLTTDFQGHRITIYPDASGQARKTNNASESDHSLLYSAGFDIMVDPSNPAVRDRVLAMNRAFEQGGYLVNVEECPTYAEGLEQQAYNERGEPDKSGGFDHSNDAGGYFICQRYPIPARAIQQIRRTGS